MDKSLMTIDLPHGAAGWLAGGVYRRSPLAGSYYPAELDYVPMTRPAEYAQGALFEQVGATPPAPVLVSLSQRYRILAELVRGLRAGIPGLSCVLVRVYGPDFNIALPADLLAADVLLVHDPVEALPSVLAAGRRNVAVIQQDLRADGPERGANTLTVALVQPDPDAALRFQAWVRECPLLQALEELRVEALGEGRPS
jgi:hypothetical protein